MKSALVRGWLVLGVVAAGCSSVGGPAVSAPAVASPELAAEVSGSQREVNEMRARCLREAGFAAEADGRGVTVVGVETMADFEASERARVECEAEVGASGLLAPEPSDPKVFYRQLYAFYLTVKACLEAEGFSVREPSSVEAFVDSAGRAWDPYAEVPPARQEAVKAARCPDTWRAW